MFIFPRYAALCRNDYSNVMRGALVSGAEMPAASPLVERSHCLVSVLGCCFCRCSEGCFSVMQGGPCARRPPARARGSTDGHLWGLRTGVGSWWRLSPAWPLLGCRDLSAAWWPVTVHSVAFLLILKVVCSQCLHLASRYLYPYSCSQHDRGTWEAVSSGRAESYE